MLVNYIQVKRHCLRKGKEDIGVKLFTDKGRRIVLEREKEGIGVNYIQVKTHCLRKGKRGLVNYLQIRETNCLRKGKEDIGVNYIQVRETHCLRKRKEDIGVNYLQEQFNSFPYETKSDTGNQLLQRIQTSLDVSLTQLNKVLTNVKDKIVSVNTDTDSSSLPRCCDIPAEDQLTYIPKFQTKVGLVSFDKEAKTPSMPSTSHSCYENDLAFATKENTDELKQHIFTLNTGTTGQRWAILDVCTAFKV
ncbi:unnamed protein product [Mytilus edulis]|uniref:Uncharacterized protein n=1 Tax=Mytilus edulis TaxID=6550 RepID=A0A8S3RTF1_MYTED|nr:unnamed protein product [Mytilus edulis]